METGAEPQTGSQEAHTNPPKHLNWFLPAMGRWDEDGLLPPSTAAGGSEFWERARELGSSGSDPLQTGSAEAGGELLLDPELLLIAEPLGGMCAKVARTIASTLSVWACFRSGGQATNSDRCCVQAPRPESRGSFA